MPKPPNIYRVLHTADWHLGKMLGDLDRIEEHERFLAALFDLILSTEADVLLVAGDVFDSANPPQSAVRMYFDFITRVYRDTNCHVVVTAGNHDSPGQIDAPGQALRALRTHVVGTMPADAAHSLIVLPSKEEPRVVIAAVPFLRDRDLRSGHLGQSAEDIQQALRDGLRQTYANVADAAAPWKERGVPVVAMGHLTVLGARTSDSERDIHVGGLGTVGADVFPASFDYVALGHLHRPQAVGGREAMRYAGSPMALSFSEAGDAKEARVLDFTDGALVQNTGAALPALRELVQLKIKHEELEKALVEFTPPATELEPWIEITVDGATSGQTIVETVNTLMEGKRCKVLRVIATQMANDLALKADESDTAPDEILNNPDAVFARRLELQTELSDDQRAALTTAFAELLGRHREAAV